MLATFPEITKEKRINHKHLFTRYKLLMYSFTAGLPQQLAQSLCSFIITRQGPNLKTHHLRHSPIGVERTRTHPTNEMEHIQSNLLSDFRLVRRDVGRSLSC